MNIYFAAPAPISSHISDFANWFQGSLTAWLFTFVAVMVGVETYIRKRQGYEEALSETRTSIAMGFLYLIVKVIGGKILLLGVAFYIYKNFGIFDISMTNIFAWIFVYFAVDFIYYWIHRAEHRFNILWSSHLIHHSARDFTFATAVRTPWTEIFYKPVIAIWAPLLGVNPIMSLTIGTIRLMVGLMQHTTLINRLGPLDKIFMTPRNHRVHHASNPKYLDKNFGGTFIIWDQMFGTYLDEMEDPVFGITKPLKDDKFLTVAKGGFPELHYKLKSTSSLNEKTKLLFSRP